MLTYSAMLMVRHYRYDLRQSMASRTCKRALRHQLKECWEALKDRSELVWAGRIDVQRCLTERQMASSSGAIHRPFDFVLGGGAVHESGLLEIRRSGSNFTRLTEPCGP